MKHISILLCIILLCGFAPRPFSSLPKRSLMKYYNTYQEKLSILDQIDRSYAIEPFRWLSYRSKAKEILFLIEDKMNTIEVSVKASIDNEFSRKFIEFQIEDIKDFVTTCDNRKLKLLLEDLILNGVCIFFGQYQINKYTYNEEVQNGIDKMKEQLRLAKAVCHFFSHEERYRRRIQNIISGIDNKDFLKHNRQLITNSCIDEMERIIDLLVLSLEHNFYFESIQFDYMTRMANNLILLCNNFPNNKIRNQLNNIKYYASQIETCRYKENQIEGLGLIIIMKEEWEKLGIKQQYTIDTELIRNNIIKTSA